MSSQFYQRRKWYLGFGLVLLFIFYITLMFHNLLLFFSFLIPLLILGVHDFFQTKHAILRNFPILGHIRFIMEFIRPELRQYIVASDSEERPFNRETRNMVYRRAKNSLDTQPFGTQLDPKAVGYTWMTHSISPLSADKVSSRLNIGNQQCRQPYNTSMLNISAMSFGSLSPRAITALNLGAQIGKFAHNTGEGGISDYHLQGGDLVFQIGTGYFGCRNDEGQFDPAEFRKEATRPEVKMIEIKLSQGAKPGHGGILPAAKLTPEIAKVRKVPIGHDVLSPIAHTAFNNPLTFLEFIQQLRELSNGKPIGFKLCVGRRSEFLSICKAMLTTGILPDFITVDGGEGGTGAAPLEFSNYVGEPLDDALVFVHNALVGVGLRQQIKLISSGKIVTGFDMIYHLALGADCFNAARAMMLSLGCVQSLQCNLNTCPTGVATQNERLQRGLVIEDKKQRVADFHKNTIHSFCELVGAMGIDNPADITPNLILRRIENNIVLPLSEIYNFIPEGILLTKKIPERFQHDWGKASIERF
jgi:glutamate synthase domain-containing protein 2